MIDPASSYLFDDVRVDVASFRVERGGRAVPLEPKAFDLLVLLLAADGRVVTKQEILESVWKDTAVTDNALTRIVAQLRRALGDDAREAKYIETVPTRGYRWIAPVRREVAARPGAPARVPVAAPEAPAPSGTLARARDRGGGGSRPRAARGGRGVRRRTAFVPGRHDRRLAHAGPAHRVARPRRVSRVVARRSSDRLRLGSKRGVRNRRPRAGRRVGRAGADERRAAERRARLVARRRAHRVPLDGARRHLDRAGHGRRDAAGERLRVASRVVARRRAHRISVERSCRRLAERFRREPALDVVGRRSRRHPRAPRHHAGRSARRPRRAGVVARRPLPRVRRVRRRALHALDRCRLGRAPDVCRRRRRAGLRSGHQRRRALALLHERRLRALASAARSRDRPPGRRSDSHRHARRRQRALPGAQPRRAARGVRRAVDAEQSLAGATDAGWRRRRAALGAHR